MPKQKTSRAARKRFKMTKNGKIKRYNQNRRHILTKKTTKRKRALRKSSYVSKQEQKTMTKLIQA